mmetsp:Transcript_84254/g.235101  ORF Transcript_84254/g.235101 Transcript_84254/m.235101 type:complete len:210 (+) Transcript_84254:723-1352(+)
MSSSVGCTGTPRLMRRCCASGTSLDRCTCHGTICSSCSDVAPRATRSPWSLAETSSLATGLWHHGSMEPSLRRRCGTLAAFASVASSRRSWDAGPSSWTARPPLATRSPWTLSTHRSRGCWHGPSGPKRWPTVYICLCVWHWRCAGRRVPLHHSLRHVRTTTSPPKNAPRFWKDVKLASTLTAQSCTRSRGICSHESIGPRDCNADSLS